MTAQIIKEENEFRTKIMQQVLEALTEKGIQVSWIEPPKFVDVKEEKILFKVEVLHSSFKLI